MQLCTRRSRRPCRRRRVRHLLTDPCCSVSHHQRDLTLRQLEPARPRPTTRSRPAVDRASGPRGNRRCAATAAPPGVIVARMFSGRNAIGMIGSRPSAPGRHRHRERRRRAPFGGSTSPTSGAPSRAVVAGRRPGRTHTTCRNRSTSVPAAARRACAGTAPRCRRCPAWRTRRPSRSGGRSLSGLGCSLWLAMMVLPPVRGSGAGRDVQSWTGPARGWVVRGWVSRR